MSKTPRIKAAGTFPAFLLHVTYCTVVGGGRAKKLEVSTAPSLLSLFRRLKMSVGIWTLHCEGSTKVVSISVGEGMKIRLLNTVSV